MAYQVWSVVFGEQPSAAKWNILGTNDASFNDGTGIGSATMIPDKLATGAATATVDADEATGTTASFVDLTTPGPAVTVTIGANGLALVYFGANITNSTAEQRTYMAVTLSGANTLAAAVDGKAIWHGQTGTAVALSNGKTILYTGLTLGSTTFTCKYRVNGNTGNYRYRTITVIPL